MKKLIGCCGLDCERCNAYLATIHHDEALREKTAKLWAKLNQSPITPDMLHCLGCRADGVKTPFCESMCEIRNCVQGKGFSTCAECSELSKCATLKAITDGSPEAMVTLRAKG